MRIGIKIGSNLLANGDGEINERLIREVCRQVATLIKDGHEVFIVSSGAVASDPKKHRSKNLRAGVGQIRLMNSYAKHFAVFGIEVSQHLLTDREVLGKNVTINKKTIFEAMEEKVVPIINGNDVVDDKELKALEFCVDNDVLFKSVCLLVNAELGIVGLGEKGFLDGEGQVIHKVKSDEIDRMLKFAKKGSALGHGTNGMVVKIKTSGELARSGMKVILAPGKEKDFILRAFSGEKYFGTCFIPEKR